MAPATQSAEFKTAVEDSRKLKARPKDSELLELYALYTVGINEKDFAKEAQPGFYQMKEKAKWNAWKKEVDAGTTPGAAQKKYVEKVEELKNTLGYNA